MPLMDGSAATSSSIRSKSGSTAHRHGDISMPRVSVNREVPVSLAKGQRKLTARGSANQGARNHAPCSIENNTASCMNRGLALLPGQVGGTGCRAARRRWTAATAGP